MVPTLLSRQQIKQQFLEWVMLSLQTKEQLCQQCVCTSQLNEKPGLCERGKISVLHVVAIPLTVEACRRAHEEVQNDTDTFFNQLLFCLGAVTQRRSESQSRTLALVLLKLLDTQGSHNVTLDRLQNDFYSD